MPSISGIIINSAPLYAQTWSSLKDKNKVFLLVVWVTNTLPVVPADGSRDDDVRTCSLCRWPAGALPSRPAPYWVVAKGAKQIHFGKLKVKENQESWVISTQTISFPAKLRKRSRPAWNLLSTFGLETLTWLFKRMSWLPVTSYFPT